MQMHIYISEANFHRAIDIGVPMIGNIVDWNVEKLCQSEFQYQITSSSTSSLLN